MEIPVIRPVLEANERMATVLRQNFADKNILVLNIMSSPGSGKTSLLEKTLTDLKNEFRIAVIEGDLQTDNDAQRIAATGAAVVQINTDGGCHLDSAMIMEAIEKIDLNIIDILFIENVGNMVCPVEFDCGEDAKISLLSTTEGDDKPEKYPRLFQLSSVMLINKIDLLEYVDFNVEKATKHAKALNADLQVFTVSCKNKQGLSDWYQWIREQVKIKQA